MDLLWYGEVLLILFLGELITLFPFVILGAWQIRELRKPYYWILMIILDNLLSRLDGSLYGLAVLLVYLLACWRQQGWAKGYSLFLTTYLFMAYQSIRYFFLAFLYSVNGFRWDGFINLLIVVGVNLLVLSLSILLVQSLQINLKLLQEEVFRSLMQVSAGFLTFLSILRIGASYLSGRHLPTFSRYEMAVSLFFFMAYLLWALHIRNRQMSYLHALTIKKMEKENRVLQKTVDKLGRLYDDIRAFRHDFAGMIAVLEPAIAHADMEEVDRIYRKVLLKTNERLRVVDYTAFNLKNVEDTAFRNTLAQAMIEAEESYIPFTLEVIGVIHRVHVPMLDVIRMMNILLNNALDGARAAAIPQIQVSLVEESGGVTCIIRNTRKRGEVDQRRIWDKGYSTKGDNRGLGLATLQGLIEQTDGVYLETTVEEVTFTQTLIFDREEDG